MDINDLRTAFALGLESGDNPQEEIDLLEAKLDEANARIEELLAENTALLEADNRRLQIISDVMRKLRNLDA